MPFALIHLACAAIYLLLAVVVALSAGRGSVVGKLLACAALITSLWSATAAAFGGALDSPAWLLDLLRSGAWYGVTLALYRRSTANREFTRAFLWVGGSILALDALVGLYGGSTGQGVLTRLSFWTLLHLLLAIGQLVLVENLYRGTAPDQRWHIALACVGLGGLALYDLSLIGDAVLTHHVSTGLAAGRPVAAILVAPLLAVAAARNRDWNVRLHASRAAVFHTATLIGSGLFLISLATVAELIRRSSWALPSDWSGLLEASLLFSGLLAIAVLLVSASSRHFAARLISQHFFTYRYDYRQEWLRCLTTLSPVGNPDPDGLPRRAICAVADIVDSPAGLLLEGGAGQAGLSWSASLNLPAIGPLPPGHPLLAALAEGRCVPLTSAHAEAPPLAGLRLWLAVPLPGRDGGVVGCILLAPPRGPFRLDEEVYALLRVLAREVATHLTEQHATRTLLETRDLRAYGERFAFVAHDIKNVAGQLKLLVANAERHLANPAFQRDMLATVEASVAKIGRLIKRLEASDAEPAPPFLFPARLAAVLAMPRRATVMPPDAIHEAHVAMPDADFDAVMTHLLDNASTAVGPGGAIRLAAQLAERHLQLDIIDEGPGMTAEFIRDELFRPFSTRTEGGSGIGAFQSRELLRRAGGDLLVFSRPGHGTTMRLLLPLAVAARAA